MRDEWAMAIFGRSSRASIVTFVLQPIPSGGAATISHAASVSGALENESELSSAPRPWYLCLSQFS